MRYRGAIDVTTAGISGGSMKFTQYLLSGICMIVALTCYLLFLAERDGKMMNYYDSTIQQVK
jgi:hypothetical protein